EPHRPLAGAEFKIEKLVKVNGNDTWVEKKFEVNQEGTQFSITGVDDGIYKLTETKAPEGYNMIKEPFYFVVGATHDYEGFIYDSKRADILNLEAYQVDGDNNYVKVDTVVLEFTSNKTSGEVSTDVVNTSGSILPSTGGMGTTVFYLLGGVLVIGAGVVLFTRRRVDAQN
ncbi:MAG: LPXTG cell wall anchor domain-containing protein, partial [Lachnospiraceae bacterium]|nr:LPXTG cell wall anchor domain-containing protein [Lachnospiraceae bacterium]